MAVISTIQLNSINTENTCKRTFKRKFEQINEINNEVQLCYS